MNPKMIGAMKRKTPGGFSNARRTKTGLGFSYAGVKEAADLAVQRLVKKGGLRR